MASVLLESPALVRSAARITVSLLALLALTGVATAGTAIKAPTPITRVAPVPMAREKSASPRLLLRVRRGRLRPSSVATPPELAQQPAARSGGLARAAQLKIARVEEMILRGERDPRKRTAMRRAAAAQIAAAEAQLRALVAAGHMAGHVYKDWARKTSEARLVQMHAALQHRYPDVDLARALAGSARIPEINTMVEELFELPPRELEAALARAAEGIYGGAGAVTGEALVRENPLVLVPLDIARPKQSRDTVGFKPRILSTNHWLRGGARSYRVGRDVAFVWVPGVARTFSEFSKQERTLLDNGVLSLRAETGSWKNPYRNAYDIAAEINRARKVTGNPDVKIVLVGYSQGNNSIHAFLQARGRNARERAMFRELRKNVVFVHDINSAARGTPVADLGVIMTKLLTGRSGEVADIQRRLSDLEKFLTIGGGRAQLALVRWLRGDPDRLGRVDRWVKRLAGRIPGRRTIRSRIADRIHDALVGQLESLTTDRGVELMTSPELAHELRGIPVVATIGVVPPERETELLPSKRPLDQTGGWKYLLSMGLPNDYQVPEARQKLEPVLRSAVDLRTQANGHWGVVGVPVKVLGRTIHDERNYPRFSPELHTLGLLDMAVRLGSR